ncbi:MAG: alanine racemase, partial [Planctomycetes bacterium]|nr:alanine racemase [Planctomycetota bacterium]
MMGPGLRVWAEIDLDAIRANVGRLKALVGPGVEVIAVAKANAYGHGSPAVVRAALSAGASAVGVGDSTEALELIDAGLRAPILVLGAIIPGEGRRVVENGIQVALHGREGARNLAAAAAALGKQARVHLFADTGMGRLGAQPAEVPGLLDEILRTPALRLVGLGTHFSTPGDPEFTRRQIESFEALRAEVAARAPGRLLVHAAASAALVLHPGARYGAVRPGLLVHGLDPGSLDVSGMGFVPALSLRTQVVHLKDVPAGTPVGYERTYLTPEPTRIATLPIGYHDG